MKKHVVPAVSCLLVSACAATIPPITSPDRDRSDPPPLAQGKSVIAAEVKMSGQGIQAALEEAVPVKDGKWDAWSFDNNLAFAYAASRDPISLSPGPASNGINLHFDAKYKLKGGVKSGRQVSRIVRCGDGEPLRTVTADIAATVALAPDWSVKLDPASPNVNYQTTCRLAAANRDITELMHGKFLEPRLEDALTKIREKGAELPLRAKAENAWQAVQSPVALADDVWLTLSAEEFYASPVTVDGHTLTVTAAAVGTPRITLGPKPNAASAALPSLKTKDDLSPALQVAVRGDIKYGAATKALSEELLGKSYEIRNGGWFGLSKTVTIDKIELYGSADNRIVLKVGLTGAAEGTIYLWGKPVYNSRTGELRIDDVDFTPQTNKVILKVANWLNHDGFKDRIAAATKWQMNGELVQAKDWLGKGLNQRVGNVDLQGKMTGLTFASPVVTREAVVVDAQLDGELAIVVSR